MVEERGTDVGEGQRATRDTCVVLCTLQFFTEEEDEAKRTPSGEVVMQSKQSSKASQVAASTTRRSTCGLVPLMQAIASVVALFSVLLLLPSRPLLPAPPLPSPPLPSSSRAAGRSQATRAAAMASLAKAVQHCRWAASGMVSTATGASAAAASTAATRSASGDHSLVVPVASNWSGRASDSEASMMDAAQRSRATSEGGAAVVAVSREAACRGGTAAAAGDGRRRTGEPSGGTGEGRCGRVAGTPATSETGAVALGNEPPSDGGGGDAGADAAETEEVWQAAAAPLGAYDEVGGEVGAGSGMRIGGGAVEKAAARPGTASAGVGA